MMAGRRRDRFLQKFGIRGTRRGEPVQEEEIKPLPEREKTTATTPRVPKEHQVDSGNDKSPRVADGTSEVKTIIPTTDPEDVRTDEKETFWTRAFEKLRDNAPELVEDYLVLLAGSSSDHHQHNAVVDPAQEVGKVVSQQRKIMEGKHWKLVFWHHEILIREKIDRIVRAFRIFEGIGSAVASLDPVHAGIPWAGVCVLLQLVTNDSDQHSRLLDGLVTITDMINFYAEAESFYLSQEVKTEPLVTLYTLVLEFQMLAAGYFARNTVARFTRNVLMLDGWSDKLTTVEKKDKECRRWVDLAVSKQIIRKLDAQSSKIEMDSVQAQTILQWLSSISIRDQHVFVRESKLGRPYWDDTGRWLVEGSEFRAWFQATGGILYLEGGVGVGKSCLVSALLEEHFTASVSRLAFFYCSQSVGETFSALSIMCSILAQLAYTTNPIEVPDSLHRRYNERLSNANGGALSLRDCEDHIIELASQTRPITIVVDALDECADNDTLLGSLRRGYSRSKSVHLFFSSRPMHLKVTDYFEEFSPTTITVVNQAKKEIQSFIEREIRSPDRRRNSCIDQLADLEMRFRDTLVDRAGAMFRWAELQLDLFLSAKRPIRHRRDFEAKLSKLESDPSLPTLTRAYDEIYTSNAEPGSFAETCVIRALRCVLGALQPLTIYQLVEAVAIQPGGAIDRSIDRPYILDVCSNFILVDGSESVSLAHLSVREYLEQKEVGGMGSSLSRCGGSARIFAFGETHRHLAEICLTTVLHSALRKHHDDGEDQMSFLAYAVAFWAAHCERIPEERRNGALRLMMIEVMSRKVEEWATFVREMDLEFVMSKGERDRLYYLTLCDPYPYVVAAWGFLEFVTDAAHGACPIISSSEYYDVSPLQLASQYGHADLVARILSIAPDDDVQVSGGPSLEEACRHGHMDIAQLLIAAVPVDLLLAPHGSSLQVACEHGHLEIVKLLISAGAEINSFDNRGDSPLQAACWGGQLEVVEYLLDHGADVNFGSDGLKPALDRAIQQRREDIVRLLLERGADPNAIPSMPGSALESAACRSLAIVELLVDSGGAIVDGVDGRYGSPLYTAVLYGETEIVRFLLDRGANINAYCDFLEPVVVTAARKGYYDVIRLLVKRGVDLAEYGPRACAKASGHGHDRIVQLLVEHGVQMPNHDDCCSITSSGYLNEGSDEEDLEHRSTRSDGGQSI